MQNMTADQKIFAVQKQLVVLLHANKCTKEAAIHPNRPICNVPSCAPFREVLNHMTKCHQGCLFVHCRSSRTIIQHWRDCDGVGCSVCEPIRILMKQTEPLRRNAGQ